MALAFGFIRKIESARFGTRRFFRPRGRRSKLTMHRNQVAGLAGPVSSGRRHSRALGSAGRPGEDGIVSKARAAAHGPIGGDSLSNYR